MIVLLIPTNNNMRMLWQILDFVILCIISHSIQDSKGNALLKKIRCHYYGLHCGIKFLCLNKGFFEKYHIIL